jgi:hypothetical protein
MDPEIAVTVGRHCSFVEQTERFEQTLYGAFWLVIGSTEWTDEVMTSVSEVHVMQSFDGSCQHLGTQLGICIVTQQDSFHVACHTVVWHASAKRR